jgi:rfaE bifunctional protein kinase chain/domain
VREINALADMRVLVLGDGIIDEYHYCETMNKSAKSPIIVNKYLSEEVFAGGAFAVANHLAGICSEVDLVTVLGSQEPREDFIRDNLKPNVKPRFLFREDSPTIVKKRYLHSYNNQKLFEVNYLNSEDIDHRLENRVIAEIESIARQCDLVLICDFGHGLLTRNVIRAAAGSARRMAVNTQTNGANAGYNLITKYSKASFICLDEIEARLAVQDRFGSINSVLERLMKNIKTENVIVTLGKKGSIGMDRRGETSLTPIFSTRVVDTVGAGDAFFAFTAPCVARGMKLEMVSFVGNAVGALAVQIIGNKKPVEKSDLFSFVHTLLT